MAEGWISIHRKIKECVVWDYDEPYTRRDAWIDLLLMANHRDKDTIFDGKKITIKRGQYLTSVRKLAEEWQWGKDKTLKYLRLLEDCEMIVRDADSRRTLITIVNYDIYQNEDVEQRTVDRQSADSEQTVSRQSSATTNNVNNDNNDNNKKHIKAKPVRHKYGQYKNVLLSDEDMEKLKTEFPNDYLSRIERVSEYCRSKGKSYSDYLATIRSWARKENNGAGVKQNNREDEEQRNREIDEVIRRIESGEADHDDDGLWDRDDVSVVQG